MSAMEPLVPDRPLTFFEMLAATFRYLRRNPGATLGIGALLGTVTSTVYGIVFDGLVFGAGRAAEFEALLSGKPMSNAEITAAIEQMGELSPYIAMALAVSLVVQFAAMGVMTVGMVRAMQGEPLRPAEVWRHVPWARIVSVNLLVFGLLLAVVALPVIPGYLLGGWALLAGLALAALASIIVASISSLAVPAAILEGLGAVAALRHTLVVTRQRIGRTVWLVFASLVVWDAVGSLIASPVSAIMASLAGGTDSAAGSALAGLVSGIVTGAITLPTTAAMAVLIYTDLLRRMRPPSL